MREHAPVLVRSAAFSLSKRRRNPARRREMRERARARRQKGGVAPSFFYAQPRLISAAAASAATARIASAFDRAAIAIRVRDIIIPAARAAACRRRSIAATAAAAAVAAHAAQNYGVILIGRRAHDRHRHGVIVAASVPVASSKTSHKKASHKN